MLAIIRALKTRWMEYMSQYNCTIKYINGDDNCVADALSRLLNTVDNLPNIVTGMFEVKSDPLFLCDIKDGY